MKQEFTPPLFKAKRIGSNEWIQSITIAKGTNRKSRQLFMETSENRWSQINPSTLCMDSGLTAEWVTDGIDKKIWSGDLFEAETIMGRMKRWEVIYENGAFWVVMKEQKELLFHFLSSFVYTKIGSIHDKK